MQFNTVLPTDGGTVFAIRSSIDRPAAIHIVTPEKKLNLLRLFFVMQFFAVAEIVISSQRRKGSVGGYSVIYKEV